MSNKYEEWARNHNHFVGSDGYKDDIEIEAEERIETRKKEDNEYVRRNPNCWAGFYCHVCANKIRALASEVHFCTCGSARPLERTAIIKVENITNSAYANRRG